MSGTLSAKPVQIRRRADGTSLSKTRPPNPGKCRATIGKILKSTVLYESDGKYGIFKKNKLYIL